MYLFIQKNKNITLNFKKFTCFDYKHRNLIKSFLIVYLDSYTADVFGPYSESKNASITINLKKKKIHGHLFSLIIVFFY